ncbi:MAG TPA: ferritin-like domain-containing protein [Phycisphaerae bacterium]|jgi:rubrerythrin
MAELTEAMLQSMGPAKALAIAVYGESVAAYRYKVLAEKALTAAHSKLFNEMAEEESGHRDLVQNLMRQHFGDVDFVLTPADKELVTVGTRTFEVTDHASFEKAMQLMYDSERRTGNYYRTLHRFLASHELAPLLKSMAAECFEHAGRLRDIKPPDHSEP